jgi:hypothetical protein
MREPGMAAIKAARADGRWDAACDPARTPGGRAASLRRMLATLAAGERVR